MDFLKEIIQENALGNEALRKRAQSLSMEDLNTPMEAGWTVAAVLAHLAFWDLRAVTLIDKWKKEGVKDSGMDIDVINEATRRLLLTIPPEKAVHLVLSAADEIDHTIEALPADMVEKIRTIGKTVHLNRADHRRMHLGEIEKNLKRH
jgi:hypothetical protein